MLQALSRFDAKWLKVDLQASFSEDGLSRLWNELVRDGEIANEDRRDEEELKDRKSPFDALLEEWTWGQEPTNDSLKEALQVLVAEQQDLSHQAVQSNLSLNRLNQRVGVLERHFIAVLRRGLCFPAAIKEEKALLLLPKGRREGEAKEQWQASKELSGKRKRTVHMTTAAATAKSATTMTILTAAGHDSKTSTPVEGLAKIGMRTALTFAFAFLRRAWRSGEDADLCTEVLDEALDILQEFPVALLFDNSNSSVWLDAVDQTMKFLSSVCLGMKCSKERDIPLHDRQKALALFLELALQRGTLQHMLDAALLLLKLSEAAGWTKDSMKRQEEDDGCKDADSDNYVPSNEDEKSMPLVPFLRRLDGIATPETPYVGTQKSDPTVASPTKCYLDYLTLPNNETSKVDLRKASTVLLSHLDRLAAPYIILENKTDGSEQRPKKVYQWGLSKKDSCAILNPEPSPALVELSPREIIGLGDRSKLVLTYDGLVYLLKEGNGAGSLNTTPVLFPGDVEIKQIARHYDGGHFLALSVGNEVYSWGLGENGELGLGDVKKQDSPALVSALAGKNVVLVAAGCGHSAAILEDGSLYSWGKGGYGRLGHGNIEDKDVPTLVQGLAGHCMVDVSCGSEDAHTLALEDNGHVWSWGDGDFGKLGRGGSDCCKVPKVIGHFGNTKIVKVKCGTQFSVALSKDGKVYTWGCGESHRLGHGDEDHARFPKQVQGGGLQDLRVVGVAVGAYHCLALTAGGDVYGWGRNSVDPEQDSSFLGTVATPLLIQEVSKQGVVYLSCGAHQSFACCKQQLTLIGTRLPFAVDVCAPTFERLEQLLRAVCQGGGLDGSRGAYPPPTQDQECMAVSALNLLRLQLQAAFMDGVPASRVGLQPGSPLLSSIRHCSVELARNSEVLHTIQSAAQGVLKSGWMMLLPTVSERAAALSQLLHFGDALMDDDSLPGGHQFMIDLFVGSLMADRGLESALVAAIAHEEEPSAATLKPGGGGGGGGGGGWRESSVPLLELVQQLMCSSARKQLSSLKQIAESSAAEQLVDTAEELLEAQAQGGRGSGSSSATSSMDLLLLFQRLLLGIIYSFSVHVDTSGSEGKGKSIQGKGAVKVLTKYLSMFHDLAAKLMPSAIETASHGSGHFAATVRVLAGGPVGALLPELAVGLVLLQLKCPLLVLENDCLTNLLSTLVNSLDKFNRLAPGIHEEDEEDLAWPGVKRLAKPGGGGTGSNRRVLCQEDIDNHNKEGGGAWLVIHGKVYDAKLLAAQAPCGAKKLMAFVGRDASAAYDAAKHTDFAVEIAKHFYVGEFRDTLRDVSSVSPVMIDTERTLSLLQGLQACFMVQSITVLPEEEESERVLSMEIFSSGLESKSLTNIEVQVMNEPASIIANSLHHPISDSTRLFICGIVHPELCDEKVGVFLSILHRYCKSKHQMIALTEQNPHHPIERFGRLFMACLLKLHDLVHVALNLVEQESSSPNNDQQQQQQQHHDSSGGLTAAMAVHLPPSLADICKLVYDAKVSLVKAHQESSCTYEEVCTEPIQRCLFMIEHIRSPMVNVMGIVHRNQVQHLQSRWRVAAKRTCRAAATAASGASRTLSSSSGSSSSAASQESAAMATRKASESQQQRQDSVGERVFTTQTSMDFKLTKESSTWDPVNLEIASSRKFKWLRERVGGASLHTTLLNQIKNFVLTDEVDVKVLHSVLTRQARRAELRLKGIKYLYQILTQQDHLLPSVSYSALCGWLGLLGPSNSISRPHYLANVEHTPPALLSSLELEFHRVERWMLSRLRSAVWEVEHALRQTSDAPHSTGTAAAAAVSVAHKHDGPIHEEGEEEENPDAHHAHGDALLHHPSSSSSSSPSANLTGPEVEERLHVGSRVVRGPDWKWGDQDGPSPSEGTVISDVGTDGWVRVRWDSGSVNSYRMGREDKYDLSLAQSELTPKSKEEVREETADVDLSDGLVKFPKSIDHPSYLILRSCVCLLRSVVVGMGLYAEHLHARNTKGLATLLHHIALCGTNSTIGNLSVSNSVAALQHGVWATLGFLRGIAASSGVAGCSLCSLEWIHLMMDIVESASPRFSGRGGTRGNFSLLQQVMTLRLLRAVLPSWKCHENIREQKSVVTRLFVLLGEVLVLCSSPFIGTSKTVKSRKHKKVRLHASPIASDSSTITEEIVVLLRRLHPLGAWNQIINQYISESLQAIPDMVLLPDDSSHARTRRKKDQLEEDIRHKGPVLAVLTVIGGLDSRPRLGGMVLHEELGTGTVAKIQGKSKVVVLFHGRKVAKLCPLGSLKALPVLSFRVDHLPMSETVMGIWSSLVRLAGTGERESVAASNASSKSFFTQSLAPAKPVPFSKAEEISPEEINVHLLRKQQTRLGLLKAARVLFSQHENLRQIMARPSDTASDDYSLFQQLLGAATRPSPIKAMFGRDELEASAVSVCQYLASEVHKPQQQQQQPLPVEGQQAAIEQQRLHKKKPSLAKKTTAATTTTTTTTTTATTAVPTPPQPPPAPAPKEPSAPSPLVSQIMEMGFPRRHIEYAIQVTRQPTNLERLVSWLLDHAGLEVPELNQPSPSPSSSSVGPDVPTAAAAASASAKGNATASAAATAAASIDSCNSSSSSTETDDSDAYEDDASEGSKFKTRKDFPSMDEYAQYVRDNICVGMTIQCCETYEEVTNGDVGTVLKVDHDGLHDLNVQANWQQKGGSYWVRFAVCELVKGPDVAANSVLFKPGDKVRVKRSVITPKYKWGSVSHQCVGVVRSISRNGTDVCVDFPEQANWTGLISEMELVPGIHPRHCCNGCSMQPIEGPRYHCQVCADFDFCQVCFEQGNMHNHAFERVDDQGQAAVYVGSPRSQRKKLRMKKKKKKMRGGSVVMDWDQIVKHLSVSSNEANAIRLYDGVHSSFWQSSGPQGKHWIRLEVQRNILIEQLVIQVEPSDSSYMPSQVAVLVGNTVGGLKELKTCSIPSSTRECTLISGLTEHYPIVEIAIRSCKSGGIDTKVHGVSVLGRVDMNEDEVAANFSFLTFNDAVPETGIVRRQHRKRMDTLDSHGNKVFVWGLNDRTQLGSGISETKVKTPAESKVLSRLRPIQLIGGSKTLFLVSQDGKVYACGEGTSGRLGVGGYSDVNSPQLLVDLSTYVVRKVAVHTSGRHAMALTADGKVFSWGDGEYGQLGHGNFQNYDRPKMIEGLQGKHVRDIACGSGHSAAITANGELYTWGQGDHGRLGHGDQAIQTKPKQVQALEKYRVTYVACGSRDAQTLVATENGTLWAWGDGSFGKLGRGDQTSSCVPVSIGDYSDVGISQLECGAQFSVMLTKDGRVYSWGKGDYYRLGTDSSTHVEQPQLIEALTGKKIVQIAVGSLHCLALSDTGNVYAWGDNEHGQQGNGTTICNRKPQLIPTLMEHRIAKISCGSSHSIAVATAPPISIGEFSPLSFHTVHDPLGMLLTSGKAEEGLEHDAKRPSLTKIVLSLPTPAKQQEALGHIQTALQIAYARDAIVNSLGGVVMAAQETDEAENEEETSLTGFVGGSEVPATSSSSVSVRPVAAAIAHHHHGLDEFTGILTMEDGRVMVDLLKLAVADRVGSKGKEVLAAVLTAMAKANPEVASMLMELCISELEDVSREPQLNDSPQPLVQESSHPYPDDVCLSNTVRMPGAEALTVTFDPRCSTERRHDVLVIKDGGGAVIAVRSGRDASDWVQEVRIVGDELNWTFKSDGSVNGWGFRFTVSPLMPKKLTGRTLLSDRALQSRPSIDLVTCLLDFQLGFQPNDESIGRLGAALSSCAQLNTLDASQRMWALQHLRKLINSGAMGFGILPKKMPAMATDTSLYSLLRSLPSSLQKQYNYEVTHVTGGSHLLHSPFFQSMVAFACDMELDQSSDCSDPTKWAWFVQYCEAARMAKSLQSRTSILPQCLFEVSERIESLKRPGEVIGKEHEDHSLFKQEQDEQLLLWTQRYPKDWTIPLGNAFSIYGWGHNHRGQLGGVEGNKVKTPRLCENFAELNPSQIVGGEQTLFAITQNGKVYTSGYGAYGRLGVGGTDNVATPTAISTFTMKGTVVKKVAVHSGGKHCLAVSSTGELYAWGEGDDGKLGLGSAAYVDTPHLVDALKGKRVVDTACGSSHSACILEDGSLYTWGKGRYGRLGHNDHESQSRPKHVMALRGEHVICVACGSGDAQTLCATASGNVYSWGDGDYGKLGRGGNEGCKVPKKVESLAGKGVIKLLCGSQFSMALTNQGHVYTWGKGDYYRLGHGNDSHQRIPKQVLGHLSNEKVVDIACGSLHCVVCTEDGKVFAWGDNDEGQIGNDSTVVVSSPQRVKIPDNVIINHVSCGSAHSVVWSSVKRKVVCPLPARVPMEFSHLQAVSMPVLRNRLILLHHFSNQFCKSLSLFGLQSKHAESVVSVHVQHGCVFEGFDCLRSIILSSSKEAAFKRVIKATMTQGKQHGPVIELNRMQVKRSRSRGGLAGPDGSKSVFGQMCSKWSIINNEELLLPHRIWKVKFIGEGVDDCGGGYSESIVEMCEELQNGSVPLLIQTPNGREDTGVNRDCFIPNPTATSPVHMNMFRFLGVLIAIAIRSGSPIDISLAPPVWKQLVGMQLSLGDLSEVDSDYIQGLVYIRENPDAFLGIEFTAPSATGKEARLHPTWTLVGKDNYQEYVRLALHMRLHEFDQQIQAMREGMARVIPVPLLSLFTGAELETMVCGSREVSVSLLKSVTTYKGVDPSSSLVRWFWEVMESFNQTERSLFLRFVWGRTRLPRTAADFRGRDFVLQVLDKYNPPDYYLPESYTCFFLLKVPRYSCKPVLEEKLRYAINFCKSIDTDDYARVNLQEGGLIDEDFDEEDPVLLHIP